MAPLTEVDSFFDLNEFAQTGIFSHAGGAGVSIPVIFDDRAEEIPIGTEMVVFRKVEALVRSADLAAVSVKDTLVVASVTYYVAEIFPDGTGITRLILSKDAIP